MGEVKYTESQLRAINFDGNNLLLSAAAGSGKTATLAARIVALISEGKCDIDEMLIVTFTRAAAAEMKSRIRKKLIELRNEKIYKAHSSVKWLNLQLSKLENAEICTIDSFLYKNMRQYFPLAEFSGDSRIASEREIDELKANVMKEVVDEIFDEPENHKISHEKWQSLCNMINQTRDTSKIDSVLLDIADELESKDVDVEQLLNKYGKDGIGDAEIVDWLKEYLQIFIEHYKYAYKKSLEMLSTDEDAMKKLGKACKSDLAFIMNLEIICSSANSEMEIIGKEIASFSFERLGSVKEKTEETELFKALRENFKKDLNDLREKFFEFSKAEIESGKQESQENILTILQVLNEYYAKIRYEKIAKGFISYHDLEIISYRILIENRQIAQNVGQKYKYIFIDEYQDTNRIQDEIFCMISDNSSRFLVGDIKQSIYRFRGAEPMIFNGYRRDWSADGNVIFMSENFRCSREIVRTVNRISSEIMPYSDVDYCEDDNLIYAKSEEKEIVTQSEVALIEKKRKKKTDESAEIENPEAEYASIYIKHAIGRFDEKCGKIIEPDDIAIIMRSPASHGIEFCDALARRGIKSRLKKEAPLVEFAGVKLIMCALEAINNPLDDVCLVGLAQSELFGFSMDDLICIKKMSDGLPYYSGIVESQRLHNKNELTKKCERLINWVQDYRTKASVMNVSLLVDLIINDDNILLFDEIKSDPNESVALNRLCDMAREYSVNAADGGRIAGFLEMAYDEIEDSISTDEDDGEKNAVSIISTHSSKGLEYPIVILCETSRARSKQDEMKPFIIDKDLGIGLKIADSTGFGIRDTLARRILAKKNDLTNASEEMRMLYVAMTRAKCKLLITAVVSDIDKALAQAHVNKIYKSKYSVLECGSYIEWILMSLDGEDYSEYLKINEIRDLNNYLADEKKSENGEKFDDRNVTNNCIDEEKISLVEEHSSIDEIINKIPSKIAAAKVSPDFLDKNCAEYKKSDESRDEAVEEEVVLPDFMTGKKKSAAEKGNAMHRFMQFMNINTLKNDGIAAEIERLQAEKYLSEAEVGLLNKQQIKRFVQSKLYKEMLETDFIEREFRFNVPIPAWEMTEKPELREELKKRRTCVTVQGVVDCVLRDSTSGELILVDYKTDSLTRNEFADKEAGRMKLIEGHKSQLLTYKKICEMMFEEPISRACIYSTVLGELIDVE